MFVFVRGYAVLVAYVGNNFTYHLNVNTLVMMLMIGLVQCDKHTVTRELVPQRQVTKNKQYLIF